ncbi:hypothetical protein ACTXT7_005659 [Hymenolepis weldensis]
MQLAERQHFGLPFGHKKSLDSYEQSTSNVPIERQPTKYSTSPTADIIFVPPTVICRLCYVM